jgi:uncharacterized protein
MSKNPSDLSILPEIFSQFSKIQAVYLFGSAASGKMRTESDLDLGIKGEEGIKSQQLDILTELARHGFCHVDLVFLNTNDIFMKYEIVRHNHPIYRRKGFSSSSFYSLIMRQYEDFYPHLKIQRKALKRRLLNDG